MALAMGHLDDPLDTFWQLVTVSGTAAASGTAADWTVATPPGVASNGGLVVSQGVGGSAVAGFGPSQDLTISPLAASSDGGVSWSTGVVFSGLDPVPDALASPTGGDAVALLRKAGGTVVRSSGGLSGWNAVLTAEGLERMSSSAGCDPTGLTASALVAYGASPTGETGGTPVVGATCRRGIRAGIFAAPADGGPWPLVGPTPAPASAGPIGVLRLIGTPTGADVLISVGSGSGATLYAAWSDDDLRTWTTSPGLPLDGRSLAATGTTPGGGFVVTAGPTGGAGSGSDAGRARAWAVAPTPAGWQSLPAGLPPTATVVATPAGSFEALVVHASTLDIYASNGGPWLLRQSLHVPVQYGSSS